MHIYIYISFSWIMMKCKILREREWERAIIGWVWLIPSYLIKDSGIPFGRTVFSLDPSVCLLTSTCILYIHIYIYVYIQWKRKKGNKSSKHQILYSSIQIFLISVTSTITITVRSLIGNDRTVVNGPAHDQENNSNS